MATFKLQAGASLDLLTKDELDQSLELSAQAIEHARIRTRKWMRLPESLSGKASGGALALGESTGQICGPRPGYAWMIKRLVITGLTSGATPDVVNLFRGTAAGTILWQFNGNNFGYTFGKGELTFIGGENLALASAGTFAAAGQITLGGELIEIPVQLFGSLL